jgi:hypothetical protein
VGYLPHLIVYRDYDHQSSRGDSPRCQPLMSLSHIYFLYLFPSSMSTVSGPLTVLQFPITQRIHAVDYSIGIPDR